MNTPLIKNILTSELEVVRSLIQFLKDSDLANEQEVLDFMDELNALSVSI